MPKSWWIMILILYYRSESSMSSFSELGACGGGLSSPQPQDLLGGESFHGPRLLSQDVCFWSCAMVGTITMVTCPGLDFPLKCSLNMLLFTELRGTHPLLDTTIVKGTYAWQIYILDKKFYWLRSGSGPFLKWGSGSCLQWTRTKPVKYIFPL